MTVGKIMIEKCGTVIKVNSETRMGARINGNGCITSTKSIDSITSIQ